MSTDLYGYDEDDEDRPIEKPRCSKCGAFLSAKSLATGRRFEREIDTPAGGQEVFSDCLFATCGKCGRVNWL